MKTTKLLALLLVTVLALSACQKSALRKDLLEYVIFEITQYDEIMLPSGQPHELLLGIRTPFEHHKKELLESTIEMLAKWRAFKIDNARVQHLIDLKVQEWELKYAAYEKLDETMLVGNYGTWQELTTQGVEIYHGTLQIMDEKIDSLVDDRISAVQQEREGAFDILKEETNFFNSKIWKEYQSTLPHDF